MDDWDLERAMNMVREAGFVVCRKEPVAEVRFGEGYPPLIRWLSNDAPPTGLKLYRIQEE